MGAHAQEEAQAALGAPLLKVESGADLGRNGHGERQVGASDTGSRRLAFAQLTLPIFLPQVVFFSINMLVTPVLPSYVMQRLGQTESEAGLAAACVSVAPAVLDMLGNLLADRLGANTLRVFGGACMVLCGVVAIAGDALGSFPVFLAARLLTGVGQSSLMMGTVLLVSLAPADLRGQAFAVSGGLARLGCLVGPAIGGQLAVALSVKGVFLAQSVFGLVATGFSLFPMICPASALLPPFLRGGQGRDGKARAAGGAAGGRASAASMLRCAARNWQDLATAGVALVGLSIVRQAKDLLIVLKVDELEGGPQAAGFVVAMAYVVDFACFPVSAMLMTRCGRKWGLGAAIFLIGAACGLLASPIASSMVGVSALACLAGAGNGVSSGLAMCVGSDLATWRVRQGRASSNADYLGPWRQVLDVGNVSGPLLVGAIAGAVSLPVAALTCTAVAFATAAFAAVNMQETARLP